VSASRRVALRNWVMQISFLFNKYAINAELIFRRVGSPLPTNR
jgi:hypothetical protein